MRVEIDQERCIGSGQCVVTGPAVFDQDEDAGYALLLTPRPAAEHVEAVHEAARGCPVQAITVVDG